MKVVYFFINGIATYPGDAKNWNKRAAVWLALNNCQAHGLLDEYFTTAATVWIHAHERAKVFAGLLNQFRGWDIRVVAHSNGCNVALDAMRIAHSIRVSELHLVAGACNGNFHENGLNWMLKKEQVGRVRIYRGGRDWAMRLCCMIAGHFLFGISLRDKPLGLAGATNVAPAQANKVEDFYEPTFGHSTWWAGRQFDQTMRRF